ncbi:MAG: XdhC family protein, partial [Cyclobacteriaceae bacterium]
LPLDSASTISQLTDTDKLMLFTQKMSPCFQLLIIGAEHDAVQLCKAAVFAGWEVTIGCSTKDPKSIKDFPGAKSVMSLEDDLSRLCVDDETAVVLMTHNYAKDFSYLLSLKDRFSGYIGLLGSYDRREKIISALIEKYPEIDIDFLDNIHGPAGLDIGAETPQEIALSIVSEILAYQRKSTPMKLRQKTGKIHS